MRTLFVVLSVLGTAASGSAAGDVAVVADASAPLTLARVLSLADTQAPDVLTADAQISVSSARVERAEAGRLPSIGLSSTLSPGAQMTVPLYPTGSDDRASLCSAGNLACSAGARPIGSARANVGADARWRLFDFGINEHTIASREESLEAMKARADAVRARTAANAVKRWLLVLADEELVAVRQRLADDRARQAQIVRTRVEVGDVSPTDVIQADVAADAAALDLAAAQAAARGDRVPLAAGLGLDPAGPVVVQGSLDLVVAPAKDLAHPDLRVADADTRAADNDKRAADAQRWPTLDGTASISTSSVGTTTPTANLTPQAGIGVALDWPVLDFGRGADQRIASANLAVAARVRSAEAIRIEGEKQRAVITLQEQHKIRERAARLVQSARAALVAVEGRYQAGAARIADLLEAQTAVAQAEATLVQARLGAAQAAVDLALAHGVVDGAVLREP